MLKFAAFRLTVITFNFKVYKKKGDKMSDILRGYPEKAEVYWDFARRAKLSIRENCHKGRIPPDCGGDYWDEDFAKAYDDIKPFLRKNRKGCFWATAAGLAFFSGPIKAETAHQALMFYLNAPEKLYGERDALESPEFIAIESAASNELMQVEKSRHLKVAKKPYSPSAKKRTELIELRAFIMDRHFPFHGNTVELSPCKAKDIMKEFGWSQSKVSRYMSIIFKNKSGMRAYAAVFNTDTTPRGYKKRFENGTTSVEAIQKDNIPDIDEGGKEKDMNKDVS